MVIKDEFHGIIDPRWTQVCIGTGYLSTNKSILRMGYEVAKPDKYSDAQIDDYTMLANSKLLWKAPLRMTVRARSSHPAATAETTKNSKGYLNGTAGFGFWNKPFTMQGELFSFPESIWFFYASQHSNMALVPGIPGWGWKAQVVHARRMGALPYAIPLSLTALYGRATNNIAPAAHWMQKFSGTHETIIKPEMTQWHTYTLEWRKKEALFWVDNELILHAPQSPTQALGFVAWLDNEYAIATPRGILKFGKVASGAQWLDMDSLIIEQL